MLKEPENLDLSKDKKQREVVQWWLDQGAKGTIVAVTGFGKTRALLLGAYKYVIGNKTPQDQKDITVIVPSNKLEDDWKEYLENCPIPWKVRTIQGLIRETKKKGAKDTGLLLIDEIHRFTSPEFGKVFNIFNYESIFGATATLDPDDDKYKIIEEKAPIIDRITLAEARKEDWVSEFMIYNLAVPLDAEERAYYDKIHKNFVKYFSTFDHDFGLMMDCLLDENKRKSYARRTGWDEQALLIHAVQAKKNIDKRKNFLYNLPGKVKKAKEIIQRFEDRVFITFSLSTDLADELTVELPDQSVSYHSSLQTHVEDKDTDELLAIGVDTDKGKRYQPLDTSLQLTWKQVKDHFSDRDITRKGKKRRREEAIELFKDPDSGKRVINTAKALDEGFNVPGINASIVLARTSKSRQSIQRLGRMLRYIEGKTAFQVELYVPQSQDERWLRKCQTQSTNIKWINSIDEIAA